MAELSAHSSAYHHVVPYSQAGNLAEGYNDAIAEVSEAIEWILITDADVMLLTPRYGHLIAEVIAANPGAGLITCVTNRIGAPSQRAEEVPRETADLLKLRAAAIARWSKYGTATTPIAPPCSGFFLLFRRAVWKAVGGFKGSGLLGVDWRFSREVAAAGFPILRMDGLLAVHFYRLDGGNKPASVSLPQSSKFDTLPRRRVVENGDIGSRPVGTAMEPLLTVAVLTRVYAGELPYLKSFIRHYTGIGVNAFYILINDARDADAIREHEAFTGCKCKFIVNDLVSSEASGSFNFSANFNVALPHVAEDYLLNVDVDEFLDVVKYGSIQRFIYEHPSAVYRFRWLLANNDGICDPTLAFQGVAGKQMCRTDTIKSINCHDFDFNREVPPKSIFSGCLLIHYWGRSFRDILIKTVGQVNLKTAKNGSLEKLKACGAPGDLPGRFKAMAAMSRIEKSITVPKLVEIDTALEEQIVRSLVDEEYEEVLFAYYQQYRDSLDYCTQVSPLAEKRVGINDYLRLQAARRVVVSEAVNGEGSDYLLIVGMHRSGTSMLAHLMVKLGYHIGKTPTKPARDNPEGFFENQEIKGFHDKLLKSLGSSWNDTQSIKPDLLDAAIAGGALGEFASILENEFQGHGKRLVKDPRMCRLMPFWNAALGRLGTKRVRCLFPIRHPLHVARSLQKRNGFPIQRGLLLWMQSVLTAERDTRGFERMVTIYDDVLDGKSVSALAGFLGQSELSLNAAIEQVAKPSLRHESGPEPVGNEPGAVERLALRIWEQLAASAYQASVDKESMDGLWGDYLRISPTSASRTPVSESTPIYRITPPIVRSQRALDSVTGLPIETIPAEEPTDDSYRAREIACSLAHAQAIQKFLASPYQFAVVLEDDAVLTDNREWMEFTQFDLFIPFASHHKKLPPNATIRHGVLTKFGTQAYLCSRIFAERYLPLLLAGGISDHASHTASAGLRVGSFSGNLVLHDLECASMISEKRRLNYLPK